MICHGFLKINLFKMKLSFKMSQKTLLKDNLLAVKENTISLLLSQVPRAQAIFLDELLPFYWLTNHYLYFLCR